MIPEKTTSVKTPALSRYAAPPTHRPADRPPVEVVHVSVSEPAEVAANGLLAMVDLRVGGILLHDLKVRLGRGDTVYINPPSKKVGARWLPYSEFVSEALAAEVRRVVLAAVSEVTR